MKKTLLFLITFLIYTLILQGARRPDWVDTRPVKPHLYQGFGVAEDTGSKEDDRLRADQNARTEIIQEISSSISSEVSSFYSESSSNDNVNEAQSMEVFSSISSAYAEATIEGIKIVDRYYDKKSKLYYSYASLERSVFQAQMVRRASEARKVAQERYAYALTARSEGDVTSALGQLSQALSHVMVAQSIVKKQLEGDLDQDGKTEFLDAALGQELGRITRNIRILKAGGDDQKGERNQGLAKPFEGTVVYEYNGKQTPLPNLPLSMSVEGAEADYQPTLSTDANGRFSARIYKLHSASMANPVVRIGLSLPHINVYADHAGQSGADFFPLAQEYHFQMDVAASVKIFVRVLEEINGEPVSRSKSDGMLIKALLANKYKVLDARQIASRIPIDELDQFVGYEAFDSLTEKLKDAADYAIVGLIASETSSTGTLNYARATANLNAIDLESGRIIATAHLEDVKAAGNTEAKANASALRKCSSNAIAELLAQLDIALN